MQDHLAGNQRGCAGVACALIGALCLAAGCDRARERTHDAVADTASARPGPAALRQEPSASAAPPGPAPGCARAAPVGRASFAPDGSALATACSGSRCVGDADGRLVDVWSLPKGGLAATLDAGDDNVIRLAWGKGGWLATVGEPTTGAGVARLFDATWTKRADVPTYCVQGFTFSPGGDALAIAFADGQLRVLSTSALTVRERPKADAHIGGDYGLGLTFTPDGRSLFLDDESVGVQIVSASTLARTFSGPGVAREGGRAATAVAPDGARALMGDGRDNLIAIDAKGARRTVEKVDPAVPLARLVFLTPTIVLSQRAGQTPKLCDLAGAGAVHALADAANLASVLVDPTGAAFATLDDAGMLVLRTLPTGAPRLHFRVPVPAVGDRAPATFAWSPKGDRIAAWLGDRVNIWDVASGDLVSTTPVATDAELGGWLDWSPDGRFVAFTDGAAHVVRVADGAVLHLAAFGSATRRAALAWTNAGFAGPPELAACAGLAKAAALPNVAEAFFAPR